MARPLTQLLSSRNNLSPVQGCVAQYVLDCPGATIFHSMIELAETARSSQGSILCFCQDLSFSEFQKLRLKLAVELAPSERSTRLVGGGLSDAPAGTADETAGDGADLMSQRAENASTAMLETADLSDVEAFRLVAEELASASRVDIYGVGASGVVAQYFAYKLLRA